MQLLAAPASPRARAPETPIERLIADTLAARGPLPGAPSCRVSRSFSTTQHWPTVGWVTDLGMLWARDAFVRALDAARGVLWELETAT